VSVVVGGAVGDTLAALLEVPARRLLEAVEAVEAAAG